ncbi:MAG TPA: hypothetical protein P5060_00270, partial [Candidatus Absconditabacterales bacterium]|nr:hypothetical protein [Candidatus Absconditabacterales bacterium]
MQKEVYKFISKQNNDPIVERRKCKRTGESFPIFQSDIDILKKISPTIGGENFEFPLPTLSPDSRMRRMMMFRNERKLYKRKCSKTGKSIIALYPEEYQGTVYNPDLWRSDDWDSSKFSMDYRQGNFYKDLKTLFDKAPYLNMFAFHNENSDYVNGSEGCKNCYMIFASDHNEDCYYSYSIFDCKRVVDAYGCKNCENSYEIIDCVNSVKAIHSHKIEDSYNIYFSYHMKNCKNTFLCVGLKDKEYCYMNKEIGKERREKEIEPMLKNIFSQGREFKCIEKLEEIKKGSVVQNMNIINTKNGIGDLINNSKNVFNSFEIHDAEDVRGVINANKCKDIFGGYVVVDDSQKVLEGVGVAKNYSTSTVWNSWTPVNNAYFCNFIMGVSNMFGSVSCRNKSYCILNKQYSKSDREETVKSIIKELQYQKKRGEFFDPEFSPFPYNDTVAMEYFPVSRDQLSISDPEKFISDAILDLGGKEKIKIKWRNREKEINVPEGIEKIKAKDLPTDIGDIKDDILTKNHKSKLKLM